MPAVLSVTRKKSTKKATTKKKVTAKKTSRKQTAAQIAAAQKAAAAQAAAQKAAADTAAAQAAAARRAAEQAAADAAKKKTPQPTPTPTPKPTPAPTPTPTPAPTLPTPTPPQLPVGTVTTVGSKQYTVSGNTVTIYANSASAINYATKSVVVPLVWDPLNHLLSRFTFGPSKQSRAELAAKGADQWIADQISSAQSLGAYGGNAALASAATLLSMTPAQVRVWQKANGNEYGWDMMNQLTQLTLGLQAWGSTQLYETLVDFWSNHLNVCNYQDNQQWVRGDYDRNVIRKYALGSFTDMLLASARHPSMLYYLNLAQSTKTAINENYGRELLELHTVGVGNYTENDVKNSAKILTGRTVTNGTGYSFQPSIHYTGPITVMGFSHANSTAAGGEAAGDAYLTYLAQHPKTAQRLALKLCTRFVSDTPSDALVAAVTDAYLSNNTQILPMVQTILHSDEFWSSRGKKVRRPAEHLLATMRVLGNTAVSSGLAPMQMLQWTTESAGNLPLSWVPPNGYPDVAAAWRSTSTLLWEWEVHRALSSSWYSSYIAKTNYTDWFDGFTPGTSGQAIDVLCLRLTGMTFSAADKATLQTILKEPASTAYAKSSLKYYLNLIIYAILDSPHHALR